MLKFDQKITVGENIYELVDIQRDKISAIYKNSSTYLRVGAPEKIKKDLELHKKMLSFGFPVAKILEEGEFKDMHFFIEESLGEKCFGTIFKEEVGRDRKISEETFDKFIGILTEFAEAQIKTATEKKNWTLFEKGTHLDLILQELPQYKEIIRNKFEKIEKNLEILPFVLSHGDFNAHNIYPKGVIDFEDSFMAPLGYDLCTSIFHLDWFPEAKEYEFYRVYDYTSEQKNKLLDMFDDIFTKNGFPKFSDYIKDLAFTRGTWSTVRMHHAPKLQAFRYKLFKSLLD